MYSVPAGSRRESRYRDGPADTRKARSCRISERRPGTGWARRARGALASPSTECPWLVPFPGRRRAIIRRVADGGANRCSGSGDIRSDCSDHADPAPRANPMWYCAARGSGVDRCGGEHSCWVPRACTPTRRTGWRALMRYSEYRHLVGSDLYRTTGHSDLAALLRAVLFGGVYKYVFWMRTCRYAHGHALLRYSIYPF